MRLAWSIRTRNCNRPAWIEIYAGIRNNHGEANRPQLKWGRKLSLPMTYYFVLGAAACEDRSHD